MRKLCFGLSFFAIAMLVACGSESGTEVSSELPPGFSKPSSERSSSDGGSDNSGESSASGNKVSSASEGTSSDSSEGGESAGSDASIYDANANTLTDLRDGQVYRTTTIDIPTKGYSEVWMAENLNYAADSSWCGGGSEMTEGDCSVYGRLYTLAVALGKTSNECGYGQDCNLPSGDVQGACPQGWHVPSKAEWESLIMAVDGNVTEYNVDNVAGKALKAKTGWTAEDGISNDDAYSFAALSAGYRFNNGKSYSDEYYANGGFYSKGYSSYFWSSSQIDEYYAHNMGMYNNIDKARLGYSFKSNGFSVRCLKD